MNGSLTAGAGIECASYVLGLRLFDRCAIGPFFHHGEFTHVTVRVPGHQLDQALVWLDLHVQVQCRVIVRSA